MDVQQAPRRQIEQHLWQQPAVCGDDADVWTPVANLSQERRLLQPGRLHDREPGDAGAGLDRRLGDLLAATARTIRLGDHTDHLVLGREQRVERGHGKGRRPEEHHSQRHDA